MKSSRLHSFIWPKDTVSSHVRYEIKKRLLQRIGQERSTESFVLSLLKNIFKPIPSVLFRESTLFALRARIQTSLYGYNFSAWLRNASSVFQIPAWFTPAKLASLGIVLVLLTSTFLYPQELNAEDKTLLIVNKGVVEVQALGEDWHIVPSQEVLHIGDKIRTYKQSSAEIVFPNYSTVRISESAEVGVSNFMNVKDASTPVSLTLLSGRIWSTIPTKHDFSVKIGDTQLSTSLGTFDVKAGIPVLVRSLQNTVQIENQKESLLLSAGFETHIQNNGLVTAPTPTSIYDAWSKENYSKDAKLHKAVLAEEVQNTQKIAGVLPGHPLYPVAEVLQGFQNQSPIDEIKRLFASSKVLASLKKNKDAMEQFKNGELVLSEYWNSPSISQNAKLDIQAYLQQEKDFYRDIFPSDAMYILKKPFQVMLLKYTDNTRQARISGLNEQMLDIQNLVMRPESQTSELITSLNDFVASNKLLARETIKAGDKEQIKNLIALQTQNLQTLQKISSELPNDAVQDSSDAAKKNILDVIHEMVQVITPVVQSTPAKTLNTSQSHWLASKLQELTTKVTVYETATGRQNALHWVLDSIDNKAENLTLLYAIKNAMPEEIKFLVTQKIIAVKRGGK